MMACQIEKLGRDIDFKSISITFEVYELVWLSAFTSPSNKAAHCVAVSSVAAIQFVAKSLHAAALASLITPVKRR